MAIMRRLRAQFAATFTRPRSPRAVLLEGCGVVVRDERAEDPHRDPLLGHRCLAVCDHGLAAGHCSLSSSTSLACIWPSLYAMNKRSQCTFQVSGSTRSACRSWSSRGPAGATAGR
jgi:hypothetical protein